MTGGVALFSGFLAILRSEEDNRQNEIAKSQSEIADKQAITAEQGQITDRLNKATENLGKSTDGGDPIIEVRLGALYALERIAQDSFRDHIQIMEILCAYIRHGSLKNKADKTEKPTEDIQAALTIIGRRRKWTKGVKRIEEEEKQDFRIKLNHCYLKGARLGGMNLTNVSFIGANLSDAWFNHTNISDAALGSADLTGAWLEKTIMKKTKLNDTKTAKVHSYQGNFSDCINFTQEQLDVMFLGINVKIPEGWKHPQKDTNYEKIYNTFNDFINAYNEWVETQP